jgi:hypothetical protein
MTLRCSSRLRFATLVVILLVSCGERGQAQEGACRIVDPKPNDAGRLWVFTFELQAPSGIKACRVTISPRPDAVDVEVMTIGPGKTISAEYQTPPRSAPVLSAVPIRPTRLAASVFGSLDQRGGTAVLGTHQALGGVAAVGFPIGLRAELGFEVSSAIFKQALDSAEIGSAAEQRLLRDTFISATIGYVVPLGDRVQLVPIAGGGFARVETRRFTYTLEGRAVQAAIADTSRPGGVVTFGGDLRIAATRNLQLVVNYRVHGLGGADDVATSRARWQHRPGIGVQIDLGGR